MIDSESALKLSDTKLLIALVIFTILFRSLGIYFQKRSASVGLDTSKNVTLLVLGDIGRSPRMQYHALSFAQNDWTVNFVGYDGATPLNSVINNPKIRIHYISHPLRLPDNIPKNPPSIPTLMVAQFVCWLRSSKLIIDWHNFGYTILSLRLGPESYIVKFAKLYEKIYGGRAHAHLAVTGAMHRELMYKWDVAGAIATLYDRPPTHFRRLNVDEIHEFLLRANLEKIISEQSIGSEFLLPSSVSSTLLTTKSSADETATYRDARPILIISSTSWTADEDFSMLLKAAQRYDKVADDSNKTLPKLLFVVTGKGPLKENYEKEISKMSMRNVRIITTWLSAEDYPLLLGSADLGVCFHTSSSGMDLPMKVVDMFGCGLPVCAFGFECIGELIQHEKNGLIFKSEEQLTEQLIELFINYPTKLENMRKHVIEFQKERWDANWNRKVLPLLNS